MPSEPSLEPTERARKRKRTIPENVGTAPHRHKPLMPRVMARIKHDHETGCWIWQGAIQKHGYGTIFWRGVGWLVHRAVYTELVGPIGDGLQIDHLCEVKACCNPVHLEPVTNYENGVRSGRGFAANALKTHCPHGHEYNAENTIMRPQSGGRPGFARFCKACSKEWWKRGKASA